MNAGATITRMGGRFTFTSSGYSTQNAGFIIGIANEIPANPNSPDTSYRIGVHVVISTTYRYLQKIDFSSGSGATTTLSSGALAKVLTADGVTEYELDVFVSGNTFYVKLPDGTVVSATDPSVSAWATQYGFHEILLQAATDYLPGWTETWTDTATYYDLPVEDPAIQFAPREIGYAQLSSQPSGGLSFVPAAYGSSVSEYTIPGLSLTLPNVGARPIWIEFSPHSVFCVDTGNPTHYFVIIAPTGVPVGQTFATTIGSAAPQYVSAPPVRVRVAPGTAGGTFTVGAYTTSGTYTYTTTGSGDTTFDQIAASHSQVPSLTGAQVEALNSTVTEPIPGGTHIALPLIHTCLYICPLLWCKRRGDYQAGRGLCNRAIAQERTGRHDEGQLTQLATHPVCLRKFPGLCYGWYPW